MNVLKHANLILILVKDNSIWIYRNNCREYLENNATANSSDLNGCVRFPTRHCSHCKQTHASFDSHDLGDIVQRQPAARTNFRFVPITTGCIMSSF